ncbi:hypothetical protein HBB16_08285 [Pseudonocardia sp. MCCB 268]|nr:hypothetical protein [Pseudonocardia cytotoxica]
MASFVATRRRPHCSTPLPRRSRLHPRPGCRLCAPWRKASCPHSRYLVAGDDVIGTLFVATRTETQFHPDQIGLLAAFADHGTVILRARLLEQARTLARSRRRQPRPPGAARRRDGAGAPRPRRELTECPAGRGHDPGRGHPRRAMQREVIVLDEFRSADRAVVDRLPRGRLLSATDVMGRSPETAGRHASCPPPARESPRGVVAVVRRAGVAGRLPGVRSATRPSAREQKLLEDAARIVALLRLKQDALADAGRVRGELLGDASSNPDPGYRSEMRARARGLDLDALRRIFVCPWATTGGDAVRLHARAHDTQPVLSAETRRRRRRHLRRVALGGRRSCPATRCARASGPTLVVEGPSLSSCDDVPGEDYREARRCLVAAACTRHPRPGR